MKKILLLSLTMVFVMVVRASDVATLTKDICRRMATYIPDHEMAETAKIHFTSEYLKAWNIYRAMPDCETYAGYIGDEFTYFFVSGNGGACDGIKPYIIHFEQEGSKAYVLLCYTCPDDTDIYSLDKHVMTLVYMNNQWLIDDYDDSKRKMQNAVKKTVSNYSKRTWMSVFSDEASLLEYERDMKHFLQVYRTMQ